MFAFIFPKVDDIKLDLQPNIVFLEHQVQLAFENKIKKFNLPSKPIYEGIKRALDIFFCIIFSPIALLFISLFGIAIVLETPGTIFYKQIRAGKNGKFFTIYKLRSFKCSNSNFKAKWTIKNDPDITFFGKIIRKTRIDELPQIWNIIKGDMSFIGPRPEQPELIIEFIKTNSAFILRNCIKPGITGWAQINGGYELPPRKKLIYDLFYIQNRNLGFDFYIFLRTIWVVLTGKGAF